VLSQDTDDDFISLTDIAKYKNPEFPADVVKNCFRIWFTLDFLGTWEQLCNPNKGGNMRDHATSAQLLDNNSVIRYEKP